MHIVHREVQKEGVACIVCLQRGAELLPIGEGVVGAVAWVGLLVTPEVDGRVPACQGISVRRPRLLLVRVYIRHTLPRGCGQPRARGARDSRLAIECEYSPTPR